MTFYESICDIRKAQINNKLVIFVGAGVSKNSKLPMWSELIKEMAKELNYTACNSCKVKDNIKDAENINCEENYNCKYEFSQEEFLKIPQYLYNKDKHKYYKIIKKVLDKEKEANALNDIIFRLNPRHIITTNYDRLFETSNEPNSVMYEPIYKDANLLNASKLHYLIKMHGDIKDLENVVLKEYDYLTYSQNHILIEAYIKSLLIDHTFLFVGYSLNDNNLKLIMAWIDYFVQNSECKVDRPKNYILTIDEAFSKEEIKKYWEYKNIYIISSTECPDIALNNAKETKLEEKAYSLYGTFECILDSTDTLFKRNNVETELLIRETYNKLLVFKSFKYISYFSLLSVLEIYRYEKYDNNLYLKENENFCFLKNILTYKFAEEQVNYINLIFNRAGINQIYYTKKDTFNIKKNTDMNVTDLNIYLLQIYLSHDYIKLDEILNDDSNKISNITKSYYKNIIGKKDESLKLLEDSDRNKYKFDDLYSLLVYKLNYSLVKYKKMEDIVRIKKLIPNSSLPAFNYLLETCSSMSRYIINMRNLYRSYKKTYDYGKSFKTLHIPFDYEEFSEIQQIAYDYWHFIRYNNINFDSWANPKEFMEYYIKSIFYSYKIDEKLESEKILDKKLNYPLRLIDIDILLSFIDYKDLNDLVNKYKIDNFCFRVSISHIFSNYFHNFEKFWSMDMNNSFNNLCLLISVSMENKLEIVQLFFEYLENANLNKAKLFTNCIDGIYQLIKNSEIKKYSDVENIIKFLMTKDVANEAFIRTQHTKYDNIIINLYDKILDLKDESSLQNINKYIEDLEANIILCDTKETNFKMHLKEILKLE